MTTYAKESIFYPPHYYREPDPALSHVTLSPKIKMNIVESMAIDVDLIAQTTSDDLASADHPQSHRIRVEKNTHAKLVHRLKRRNTRFQRTLVATSVNQHPNCENAAIALNMAKIARGKVHALSVVTPAINWAELFATGPMVIGISPVSADCAQTTEKHISKLTVKICSKIDAEIAVRSGQIEQVIIDDASDCNANIIVTRSPNCSSRKTLCHPSILPAELQVPPHGPTWWCHSAHRF